MIYGYARVSTDGQSVDAQVRQLTKAGCKKVFRETASGAKTDRTELAKALAKLDSDDVLMVTRLDRLARSTRDLLNTLGTIAERKAGFDGCGTGLYGGGWGYLWGYARRKRFTQTLHVTVTNCAILCHRRCRAMWCSTLSKR
jgi:hypothetical protein